MNIKTTNEQTLALSIAAAWNRMERRLDSSLGAIRGISFAEYRLLQALADSPAAQASRVDLAHAVGLTPSGVTRALRPMEKLGVVSTLKSKRDARLAIAALTPAGREILNDANSVVHDTVSAILSRSPQLATKIDEFVEILDEFGR